MKGTHLAMADVCPPIDLRDTQDVLLRVHGEYLEMPGLRLTLAQAQRLWGLDAMACQSVLNALVETKFLRRAADGRFVRLDSDTPY